VQALSLSAVHVGTRSSPPSFLPVCSGSELSESTDLDASCLQKGEQLAEACTVALHGLYVASAVPQQRAKEKKGNERNYGDAKK
jgi:hypothetical protein